MSLSVIQAVFAGFRPQQPGPYAAETTHQLPYSDTIPIADNAVLLVETPAADTMKGATDTTKKKNFLDHVISGKNRDSLVYDVKNKMVYIFTEGDVNYQSMNMKADYMSVNMDTKEIYGYGVTDTLGNKTRPEFIDGGKTYTMDTINYNIATEKAKIKGVATQEGEGFLIGDDVKKMSDNTINLARGKYTTCDNVEHPHFYLAMTRAKVIPKKKVVAGPSYLVMEDVPIYFLGIPEGFFPMVSGRSSGFIVPSYGEEYSKGFFLREGGYYFAINDYLDLTLLGGIYTLGSWDASVDMNYRKRYKYNGYFQFDYSKIKIGDRGTDDYINNGSYSIHWTHTQDPKFRPNSSFNASVDFSSTGYNQYGTNNLDQYLNTQTSSSISYSKSWAGTPFSISIAMDHSQNSRDSIVRIGFPKMNLNMSRIYPFKRREAVGKERWYEKIALSYSGNLTNSTTVKEPDLFTDRMFKNMTGNFTHNIPVSTSFNFFNYLNLTPSANYKERWFFRKVDRAYDPVEHRVINADTTYGFYRVYDYNFSGSFTTKLYGTYHFKSKKFPVQDIRHVATPTVGFSYMPNFSDPKYGFMKRVQSDSLGNTTLYSPYDGVSYGGRSASLNFGLSNTVEIKVRSKKDTAGIVKRTLIDELSLRSSYNFMADSLNLAPFSITFRSSIIKNFGLNFTATWDPYQVNERGVKINKFHVGGGKFGRLTSIQTSFGYTFGAKQTMSPQAQNSINGPNGMPPEFQNPFLMDPDNPIDPLVRRQMMTALYYDFNIPWNLSLNYSFNYSKPGVTRNINQTIGFSGSITLTPKWGITFAGSYDIMKNKLTPGTVTLTRDLHCWQMSFTWIPIGNRKSWNFTIGVKSAMLSDLKYEKTNSYFDNLLDR